MDIDKFVHASLCISATCCFGSLMDIDKFVQQLRAYHQSGSFGSLMDIDKFVLLNMIISRV